MTLGLYASLWLALLCAHWACASIGQKMKASLQGLWPHYILFLSQVMPVNMLMLGGSAHMYVHKYGVQRPTPSFLLHHSPPSFSETWSLHRTWRSPIQLDLLAS